MGYYTDYKLSFENGDEFVEFLEFPALEKMSFTQLKKSLKNVEEHFTRMEALKQKVALDADLIENYLIHAWNNDLNETKWYEHEEDMKRVSKAFPETLFILEGNGEEKGDIWRKYFKNGKVQVSKIVISFDAFDEKKLK